MKKFFGWLFVILGVGNIIAVFAMSADGVSHAGGQSIGGKLFFGIGLIGLGVWMISSAKKKDKNSVELKQLLESGILSKEEFNNIVNKLGISEEPNTDIIKENVISIEEKEKTNQLGLFLILISIIGIISFIGYNLYNKNKEIHRVKTIPIESNYQNPIKDERKVNKKFLIATFKTEEPQVDYFEGVPDIHHFDGGFIKGVDSKTFVFLEERNYYSDIQEILNYNEDEKYKFLDAMESIMEDKLFMINVNFRSSLSVERDRFKRTSLEENKAKVISRDVVVFDSYSEASRYKQNMTK